jgi:hypothetical protein
MQRIRTIKSYAGHARYLAGCQEEPIGEIDRQSDIPSPHRYSPRWTVWTHIQDGPVVIVETAHKRYEVFAVEPSAIQAVQS